MFANAHSIARMYAATVSDIDGIRLLKPDTVAAMTVARTDRTRMHGVPPELLPATKNLFNMSLGFWRSSPRVMPMLGPASFGHAGSGGSPGAADPKARVGLSYVFESLGGHPDRSARHRADGRGRKVPRLGGDRRQPE
jgi:hypothetical protein